MDLSVGLKRENTCLNEENTSSNECQNKMLKADNEVLNKEEKDQIDETGLLCSDSKETETNESISKTQRKKLLKKERWEQSKAYRRYAYI
jgi:hypothetical protein